ncbi:MAG: alpha/beta fold hydrolase [Candidatus Obscuribacterales bacterium]|nr:alpha/beta fold hydrolase [Candidatus Obscuribacterales bacterium]
MPYLSLYINQSQAPFEVIAYLPDYFLEIEKPPVLIFLHGSGESGSDPEQALSGLDNIFEELQLPAVVVFPQCDENHRAFYGDMEVRVLESIDYAIETFLADQARLYLIGYSMGASSALWLAARYPGKFAGMISIAPGITWMGAEPPPKLPSSYKPLFDSMFVADNRAQGIASQVLSIPIWFLQGTQDEPCPIDETRHLVSELKRLGRKPIVTEYEGMTHDSLIPALCQDGLFDWLFELRVGTSS